MARYWVVGGEYKDTQFKETIDGKPEEKFGPFGAYRDALKEWQSRAWMTVDQCHRRYRIVAEDDAKRA